MHDMSDLAMGYVVTGGGRGVGRAIVDRLLVQHAYVAVIERDEASLDWVADHPAGRRIVPMIGSAADEVVATRAADAVEAVAPLVGWVNNAAIFRDATVHETSSTTVMDLISANLAPTVTGSVAAIRCYLRAGRPGAIVNLSSHQAQRAVRGAVPYATSKAAVEGLTRALAVDYGRYGIRVNAVALGSISTERYEDFFEPAGRRRAAADLPGDGAATPAWPGGQGDRGRLSGGLPSLGRRELHLRRRVAGRRWALGPRAGSRGALDANIGSR